MSDRVIVLLRPGNAGGGKDPDFWCAPEDGEGMVIGESLQTPEVPGPIARQLGWPVVLPHPKMLPRRRELSHPNAPWFLSPLAAVKPSRVTDDARSDVPVSTVADPSVGAGRRVR